MGYSGNSFNNVGRVNMFGLVTKKKLDEAIYRVRNQCSFMAELSVANHRMRDHADNACTCPEPEEEAPAKYTYVVTYVVGDKVKTAEVEAYWVECEGSRLTFTNEDDDFVAYFSNVQSYVRKDSE